MAALTAAELRQVIKGTPTYNEGLQGQQSFKCHLRTYDLYCGINGLHNAQQRKLILLYSLRGASSDRAQHMLSVANDENVSYPDFLEQLQSIFLPTSEH
jgi:hypothetical protein